MEPLNRKNAAKANTYPERILQFGEGNFLRAFSGWVVHRMNQTLNYNSGIVVVQPLENGMAEAINRQDGLYHLLLRGVKRNQPVKKAELIDNITRAINPYTAFDSYLKAIDNPQIRIIVSNTTEAGIAYHEGDKLNDTPQKSFPGKITALLFRRFQQSAGDKNAGLAILCCELIDRNADKLKEIVLRYATEWDLGNQFTEWVNSACDFCNTLVDRIVPGFPFDEKEILHQELGFEDNLMVVGEYYYSWVIEANERVKEMFPAHKAGLNVKFVADNRPLREEKVRILNGAHTGTFAVAMLSNSATVRDAVNDPMIGCFLREMIMDEVLPAMNNCNSSTEAFAEETLERFYNPYINHYWKSIALNAVSKWETRNLPSLNDYYQKYNRLPKKIVFSLAALIAFYRNTTEQVNDHADITTVFSDAWGKYNGTPESINELCNSILSNRALWKRDLSSIKGLVASVSGYLFLIEQTGMQNAIRSVLGKTLNLNKAA